MDLSQIEYCIMQNCSTEQLEMVIEASKVSTDQAITMVGILGIIGCGIIYLIYLLSK